MAQTIDELQVLITAQTDNFNKQIGAINKELDTMSNSSSKLSKTSVAAFGAIAGAAQTLVSRGINLITDSIGNAAKRIDTLNNSQRVFQNLGFSAKDTKEQMDFLDQSIRGLPTTLNDAVTGVEALASVSGDLKDSTKTYKAINDGILAMGGSAYEVQGAIQQLSQLPLDGPLDAQTWNSLRQNGLTPVITAMSKDMGLSISQMKDDFSKGKLTVKDFTDELQKLDTQGGGGMASLEKQAHDATNGIQTGWVNAKTAITRGVADIIKAVGSSNISGVLSGIGKDFEKGLAGVAGGISTVKNYLGDLAKMDPQQAANSIGKTLGDALRLAFQKISIGVQAVKKMFDSIDWFSVGEFIVTKLLPGFLGGLVAGLGSDELWKNIWSVITQHWGAILIGALTIALAPAKLLGPITKILDKIPLIGPLTNWIIRGIRGLFGPLRDAFGSLFGGAFDSLAIRVMYFVDNLKAIFGTVFQILWAPFDMAIRAIAAAVDSVPGLFSSMLEGVKAVITVALNVIKTIFISIFNGIFTAIKTLFAPFTEFFRALFAALGKQLEGVPSMFGNAFRAAWDGIRAIWSAVTGWFGNIWNGIRNIFSGVSGWFGSIFSGAYNAITGVFSRLGGFFSGVWGNIVGIFRGAGTSVGNAIGGAFRGVINSVLGQAGNILNGFINTINSLKSKIPVIGSKIPSIPHLSIPRLATGGIVTAPTLAEIGEGGQPEAVIPLDKLEKMTGSSHIIVKIGEDTLIDKVVKGINRQSFMGNATVIEI